VCPRRAYGVAGGAVAVRRERVTARLKKDQSADGERRDPERDRRASNDELNAELAQAQVGGWGGRG
jgi:hypothetical protein